MRTVDIIFKTLPLTIDFTYIPGEPMVRYYKDGSGYPGSPAEIEIHGVFHKGEDISDFINELEIMGIYLWDDIEELVFMRLEELDEEI